MAIAHMVLVSQYTIVDVLLILQEIKTQRDNTNIFVFLPEQAHVWPAYFCSDCEIFMTSN